MCRNKMLNCKQHIYTYIYTYIHIYIYKYTYIYIYIYYDNTLKCKKNEEIGVIKCTSETFQNT